jgi:hypothetical protein
MHFCKSELNFLGHRISKHSLSSDRESSEAILNYTAPLIKKIFEEILGSFKLPSQVYIELHRKDNTSTIAVTKRHEVALVNRNAEGLRSTAR